MGKGVGGCHGRGQGASARGGVLSATPELLRYVSLDDYRLAIWDTHRRDENGKTILAYRMWAPSQPGALERTLFEGDDLHLAPGVASDSDQALREVLGFLTLRPGDTDEEYFAAYTPEQRAFAEGDAEELQMYAVEDGWPFTNVDTRTEAVFAVDARHGYTVEFSSSPEAHAAEYDQEELAYEPDPPRCLLRRYAVDLQASNGALSTFTVGALDDDRAGARTLRQAFEGEGYDPADGWHVFDVRALDQPAR